MKSLIVMSGRWIVVIGYIWMIAGCLGDENVDVRQEASVNLRIGSNMKHYKAGCLFSGRLCDEEQEWCYDDYAFGRCLPLHGTIEKEAFYRFELLHPDLHALKREMDSLFKQGYRWSHTYTQCVMQALLEDIHLSTEQFDRSICDPLADQDLEAALKAIEGDEQEQLDQRNMAYVQFTPSASNPHPEFADEVYFPPLNDEDVQLNVVEVDEGAPRQGYYPYLGTTMSKRRISSSTTPSASDEPSESASLLLKRLSKRPHLFNPDYNTPDAFREGLETRDELTGQFSRNYNTPDSFRDGHETRDEKEDPNIYVGEATVYFRADPEKGLLIPDHSYEPDGENDIPNEYYAALEDEQRRKDARVPEEFLSQSPRHGILTQDLRHMAELLYQPRKERVTENVGGGYAEGGLVFLPDQQQGAEEDEREREQEMDTAGLDDGLDAILARYGPLDWGFKRRERLDVKKPGPPFSTNNYAFRNHNQEENAAKQKKKNKTNRALPDGAELWERLEDEATHVADDVSPLTSPENQKQEDSEEQVPHMIPQKKELPKPESTGDTSVSDQYDIVDTTYAYIGFKDRVHNWQDGTRIVNQVAKLLGIEPQAFTNTRVDHNEVAFKVEPNTKGLNASEVAKKIESIKVELKRKTGVEVTSAGIGNKTKLPPVLIAPDSQHELYIATFLLCGAIAAVLVAATALYVIRRHARSREKLQNLTAPDTEASKDYQELCRARMANKAQQEKPEPIHVGQRIASLSRESEGSNNSPSSRSSTSSWSEEPALTNMDISTGHMVLSYMEDHLKNKDRLEQEWVALCAYEAEPCATSLAQKPENIKKNRYPEFLPYDHSRVVLNDLANISSSDYINASTITDHDPRNPAYIATQGPLPHTAPDFWQMVWEQGSVVMVMLTRLTEGGTAMCHRYWPEEGSELYHIYEVHLVSEHIWCDDYLVRSFYLKNLKTGETRTVTQFHFLSWPDAGVPLSTKALLEFRRKVNKSYRGRSCPIVVHCSDGVGRTGTYCLIDMVLNRMAKGAKEIDIAATLEHIRDQRQDMVRTKQQFEFVLMAVAEEVHAILKALPSQQQAPQQQPQQNQQQPQQQQKSQQQQAQHQK